MSITRIGGHGPEPPDDHRGQAFVTFCQELTLDQKITFVKCHRPEWTVRQIADLLGISTRTVLRSPGYRRLRAIDRARPPAQSKWRGRTRRRMNPPTNGRGFSNPDDPQA